jgi:hypothetical protein
MLGFARIFLVFTLPVFGFVALRMWRPGRPYKPRKDVSDRIAWTIFVFGISLMFNMFLYAAVSESDGDYRSWETIRLHVRLFLAIAVIPVAGPLIVFLYQAARSHPPRSSGKKPPVDDLLTVLLYQAARPHTSRSSGKKPPVDDLT